MKYSFDYLDDFCNDRKRLIKKYPTTWRKVKIVEIEGLRVLELPSPELLAGFSSYLKFHCEGDVYFRGEKYFNKTTIPKLFRDMDGETTNEIITRKQAFDDLVGSLESLYGAKRFKDEDFSPLLQHYGIKTDWLDLVDNIFVALWFSNHCSKEAFSYVKFFSDTELEVRDLRKNYSSLSLRPHCQHGFSATKKDVKWDVNNIDFNDNRIAIVKLPNISQMKLYGYIFSEEYMFPAEELDNTFKLLRREKFQANLDKITSEHRLAKDALGKIE